MTDQLQNPGGPNGTYELPEGISEADAAAWRKVNHAIDVHNTPGQTEEAWQNLQAIAAMVIILCFFGVPRPKRSGSVCSGANRVTSTSPQLKGGSRW